jgi:hypothetical protein
MYIRPISYKMEEVQDPGRDFRDIEGRIKNQLWSIILRNGIHVLKFNVAG